MIQVSFMSYGPLFFANMSFPSLMKLEIVLEWLKSALELCDEVKCDENYNWF